MYIKLLFNNISVVLFLFFATFNCLADSALKYSTKEIAKGLYVLQGVGGFTGGNIALSIGDDGVVMIDDGIPKALDIMQLAINRITDKPIDFLINTHFHWDHAGNNGAMAESGARIFAHQNARQRLRAELGKAREESLPVFTFTQQMHFHLNGNDIQIFYVGHAHTDGDIIVYFKNVNVIHTGDVYINGLFPYIDIDNGGSIAGMIDALQKILVLTDTKTTIIPGHGALASRADLEATVAMLKQSKQLVSQLIIKGKSEDEVVALNPLERYQSWSGSFIDLERMTRQVYASLTSEH